MPRKPSTKRRANAAQPAQRTPPPSRWFWASQWVWLIVSVAVCLIFLFTEINR